MMMITAPHFAATFFVKQPPSKTHERDTLFHKLLALKTPKDKHSALLAGVDSILALPEDDPEKIREIRQTLQRNHASYIETDETHSGLSLRSPVYQAMRARLLDQQA